MGDVFLDVDLIFDIIDKTDRKIHLSKERWSHIRMEHPEILEPEELIKVLQAPIRILLSDRDSNVAWYFIYNKLRRRYLKVSVRYLNGEGYVITTHYTAKIQ